MHSKWVQEECSHFHWLLTHLIRKKGCFCKPYENRGGYRAADERHKIVGKFRLLPAIVFVHPGLSPHWAEFCPKDMLSRFGAQ